MALSNQPRKAAFLDRDGVLNFLVDRGENFRLGGKPFRLTAPFNLQEVCLVPNVREALEVIGQKGYLRILVTNQPDIATGHIQPDEFERIMDVFRALPLDAIYACTHHPKDKCACRKPAPGMLLTARDEHHIDFNRSYMIGDMETDIQVGKTVGVKTILVSDSPAGNFGADHRVKNIMEAAYLLPFATEF